MAKACRKCHVLKDLHHFHPCEGTPDGLQYNCAECAKKHWLEVMELKRKRGASLAPDRKATVTIKALMKSARKRAKRDGIPFNITDKDITLVHVCPIRGVPLVRNEGKISPDNYSLDRRDNSKGYLPGNVFIISWLANQSKSNMNIEQLERLLKYMRGTL